MAKFNEYPAKTTPKDADKFMLYSAEDAANKLIDIKDLRTGSGNDDVTGRA